MSVNWVMLSREDDFIRLPSEQLLYTSPPRTSISVQSLNNYPGREPFSITSNAGKVHLTNRRIIYLPTSPTSTFQSFAAPLSNLHDTRVTAPWFGPNVWVAVVQPVLNGGIPSHHPVVELKMSFNEGGAYDFHTKFVQLKERLQQMTAVAAESGQRSVDPRAVHLEQLPAYEEALERNEPNPNNTLQVIDSSRQLGRVGATNEAPDTNSTPNSHESPPEPPPGYEETQRDSLAESLERSMRVGNY